MRSFLAEAKEMLTEIADGAGLRDAPVTVRVKILTPEEAIGEPGRRDFPILVGREARIKKIAAELNIPLDGVEIIEPVNCKRHQEFVESFYELRQRKGVTHAGAEVMMERRSPFAAMLLKKGMADALISGITQQYPDALRPILQVIKPRHEFSHVAGLFLLIFKDSMKIFADISVNIDPSAEVLSEIALMAAEQARALAQKNVIVVPTKTMPQGISAMLAEAGLTCTPVRRFMGRLWCKIIVYSAINSLSSVLRVKNGQLLESMEAITLMKRLIDEGRRVAEAQAVDLVFPDLYQILFDACRRTADNLSSMLQDVLNNRRTEIEAQCGALAAFGREKGIAAPTQQTMTELVKLLAEKNNE